MEKNKSLGILTLSKELQFKILFLLPYDDVINYCLTCKLASTILLDGYFWKKKTEIDTQLPIYCFHMDNISPHIRYKYLYDNYKASNLSNITGLFLAYQYFHKSIKNHDISILKYLLGKYEIFFHETSRGLLLDALEISDTDIFKYLFDIVKPDASVICWMFGVASFNRDSYYQPFVNNKNNYDIVEYLFENLFFDEDQKKILLKVILMCSFCENKFRNILNICNYDVNDLLLTFVGINYVIIEDDIPITVKRGYTYVSIHYLKWLLINYDFDDVVINKFTKSLFNSNQNIKYIEILSATKKLHLLRDPKG